jgi:hypothetical protein
MASERRGSERWREERETSSPRWTSGGAPAGRGSGGGSARSEGEIVARKWATSGRNCASGGCFSLKNRTAGSFWKKHSASCTWDRLGGGGRRSKTLRARNARRLGRGLGALARSLGRAGLARALWAGVARGRVGECWRGDGPRRWELAWAERGGKRGGRGRLGRPKWAREGGLGHFPSLFIPEIVFFFLFTPLDSNPNVPQFQINTLKHRHQTKVEFRVQHDAAFHTPLEFSLLDYNYK